MTTANSITHYTAAHCITEETSVSFGHVDNPQRLLQKMYSTVYPNVKIGVDGFLIGFIYRVQKIFSNVQAVPEDEVTDVSWL